MNIHISSHKDSFYLHHHSTRSQFFLSLSFSSSSQDGICTKFASRPHDLNGNKDKIDDWKHIRRIPIDFDEHGFLVSNKFISYIK